ncbi:hypothetical protein EG833_03645, partial [archaeon]|nr:hypothetical protein [archaeon]
MSRFMIWLFAFIALADPASGAILDVEAEYVKKSTERVEAYGNVVLSGEDIKLKANYVVYDMVT